MDVLYYSNYCKHSQQILGYLVKSGLADRMSFLCIDKRERDSNTNQIFIILEDGKRVAMPPNVQSVPALLLVKERYRVILGDDIITYYNNANHNRTFSNQNKPDAEPVGTSLSGGGGVGVISEQFTTYGLSPSELSSKGNGAGRSMHNYVSANETMVPINAPPDTYHADKVSSDVTIDMLQQKRMDDIPPIKPPTNSSLSI